MKKLLIGLIVICVFAVCGYFGYRGYIKWRQVQLVKQARVFLEKSDSRNAYLCLQRAIQANPFDIEACRLMAELAEASRSPAALMWRSRVVELSPSSVSDRLDLAKVALVMRDYAAATNALDGVSEDGKKTAEFHNIAGAVASVTGPAGEAQRHFAEAVRISPTNVYAQINLAVVQLRHTNANSLTAGRTALNTLRNHPEIGNMALRELTLDAVRHKQLPNALAMSDDLLKKTNAVFADRLLRLSILRELKNADLATAIAACQRDAVTNPAHLHELVIWKINSGMSADALRWLQSLPIDVQTNQPAALLAADCYSMQNNWTGLQTFLSTNQWGDIDFLRRAYLARSLRQQQMSTASKAEWEGAVKAAGGQRV
ncbi:MAG TPA: hypothetical protein P5055_10840, partial [Candidatus Paceibacterota bacterium]|nr:hypothetical protein [Candidatus Paceibacterota bacterium]